MRKIMTAAFIKACVNREFEITFYEIRLTENTCCLVLDYEAVVEYGLSFLDRRNIVSGFSSRRSNMI